MYFDIFILIIIVITSFIQSIFGVGVLLFGTPLLLLLGYDFIAAVTVLLPISMSINLIQIAKDYRRVDWHFYKKIFIYTIPFIVVFLFVVTRLQINIGIVIGLFLLLVAAKDYSPQVNKAIKSCVKYEKGYFIVMGIIHGLTNLGGSLLTAIVHSKGYEKPVARATIALAYATFALFQLLTLLLSTTSLEHRLPGIGIYWGVSIAIFILTEKLVYREINNERYAKSFAMFLLVSGLVLCAKAI
jgi:uncharacterized membrane protein YfcA